MTINFFLYLCDMKILFVGDYSNLHACLASELRRLGHSVTVVSDRGGYQQTSADIVLSREEGRFGKIKYMMEVMRSWPRLEGYDVVQFINPHFLKVKPGKLAYFFRELKRRNGKTFLTLSGNDYYFVKDCLDGKFRFSEFRAGNERTPYSVSMPDREEGWMRDDVRRYHELFYDSVDGAMSVLPEYDIVGRKILGDRCVFTNIPIDLTRHSWRERSFEGVLKVIVGMKPEMSIQKGTGYLYEICRNIAERSGGKIVVDKVGGLPYADYLRVMNESDILIDQLYSYSPATNALDAMSQGLVCASGAQPEYYDMIGESELRPVISLSPLENNLESYLEKVFSNRGELRRMSREGRRLVEKHNDVREVVKVFISHWNGDKQR